MLVQVVVVRFGIGVFDSTWLDHRFALFQATMLPSLRAQSAKFHLAVQIDECLPARYKSDLADAIAPLSNAALRPISLHRFRSRDHLAHIAQICSETGATHYISTRCDDDDALTADAFGHCQDEARKAIENGAQGAFLAIRNGLRASLGERVGQWQDHQSTGIGLSLLLPAGSSSTIYNFNHMKIPEFSEKKSWPLLHIEADQARWLYAQHKFSDNNYTARIASLRREALTPSLYDSAEAMFPLDREALARWLKLEHAATPLSGERTLNRMAAIESEIVNAMRKGASADIIAALHEKRMAAGAVILGR
jgi:hypothetical protein